MYKDDVLRGVFGRSWIIMLPRKVSKLKLIIACTKTDTGRKVEYTKVSERTIVKELGKMAP